MTEHPHLPRFFHKAMHGFGWITATVLLVLVVSTNCAEFREINVCNTNEDCGAGQVCTTDIRLEGRRCFTVCTDDSNCPSERVCEQVPGESTRVCRIACDGDGQCGLERICEPTDDQNRCAFGCRDNTKCSEGRICDADTGQCIDFRPIELPEAPLTCPDGQVVLHSSGESICIPIEPCGGNPVAPECSGSCTLGNNVCEARTVADGTEICACVPAVITL